MYSPQINYYTDLSRRGAVDEAFHGLSEFDPAIVPELELRFRAGSDVSTREFLLRVISQYRQGSSVALLGQALLDPEPQVWQVALDGLVSLGSAASIKALRSARDLRAEEGFLEWLDEAIAQAES